MKKRIINVRKSLVTIPFIASILITGLASCHNETKEYIPYQKPIVAMERPFNKDKRLETVTKEEEIENTEQDKEQESILEKKYLAEDILVVNTYNPVTDKNEYYFMELCVSRTDDLAKENYLKYFANTPFVSEIESEEAIYGRNYYLYTSIFEDATYSLDFKYVLSDTGTGMTTNKYLQTSSGASLSNINYLTTMKNNEDNICNTYGFVIDENTGNTYYEEDSNKYTIYTGHLYLGNNDYYTISELENILNDLNEDYNLGRN